MKIKASTIPSSITFLDHWLYELRRIYSDLKPDCEKDWTSNMRNERELNLRAFTERSNFGVKE